MHLIPSNVSTGIFNQYAVFITREAAEVIAFKNQGDDRESTYCVEEHPGGFVVAVYENDGTGKKGPFVFKL